MFQLRHLLGHKFLHKASSHGSSESIGTTKIPPSTAAQPIYYPIPTFNLENRYDPAAPYNLAPRFSLPKGFGLPLARNFDYDSFIKTTVGNNTETTEQGLDLPLFIDLPNKPLKGSFQWDSFPAGEAQQFLVFSVTRDLINSQPLYNGENFGSTPVVLDAQSSSESDRPFTVSLTVTPYNAGPIPHIHWAEDEWFIILQGEIDSWIGDPTDSAYELYEFPEGSEPLPSNYDGPVLTSENIDTFYYNHMTAGQAVYLPRGYAHSYRNASPTGDPLVFLTIWSRTPGYPAGGIEQFFTLPDPLIGRFYDTSNAAAAYGNLYNKNVGSADAISNQQRLVDYYNTFPDYFVAMSRNFGSFVNPESAGGNWNPAIPYDTTPFGTPPPAFWVPGSDQPWLADGTTPGAQTYYLPPAPNAPSTNVSFATPVDPTVVQISTFTYNGPNDSASLSAFERLLTNIHSILSTAPGAQYSLLLDPESLNSSTNSYVIQTTWDTYSSLHNMQRSPELSAALNKALQSSSLSTTNNTVNPDVAGDNQQMLIGRFQIAPGAMEEVLELSAALKQQTNQESGNISFDYYLDDLNPSTIVYIEHYTDGAALTNHLLATYTTAFFAQLGPLTASGLLADGNVGIYPVNSNISQFYPEQLQGLDLLTEIISGMPDLHLTLSSDKGKLLTAVPSGNTDIGGYISVSNSSRSNRNYTYGYLDPDSKLPVILFESSSSLRHSAESRALLERKVPVISGQAIRFFRTDQSAVDIMKGGLSKSAKLSSSNSLKVDREGRASFDGLEINLDVPYQGIEQVSSNLQTEARPLIDTTQMPRRDIAGEIHLFDPKGRHIDSSSDFEFGIYQVADKTGAVIDPVTGKRLKSSNGTSYIKAVNRLISGTGTSSSEELIIEGGFLYSPYLKSAEKIYTPYNSGVKITGANTFLFDVGNSTYLSAINFMTSENIPLLG